MRLVLGWDENDSVEMHERGTGELFVRLGID